jgi:hypothetical protein
VRFERDNRTGRMADAERKSQLGQSAGEREGEECNRAEYNVLSTIPAFGLVPTALAPRKRNGGMVVLTLENYPSR